MSFDADWAYRVMLRRYPLLPSELAYHFALLSGMLRVHPPIANDLDLIGRMDDTTQAVYAAYLRGAQ